MAGTETQVKVQRELTDTFEIMQGLKQGDGLAPMLFNLSMQYVIRKLPADDEYRNLYIVMTFSLVVGYQYYIFMAKLT
jgi:hypothetical protein